MRNAKMKFSVLMPSRNRPALFKVALDSVLRQTSHSFEIVAINDGSDETHLSEYRKLEEATRDKARFIYLPRTQRGHGQSFALNFGAAQAFGEYLCFLDDDDEWTDPDYLQRVAKTLDAAKEPIDIHFANQAAYANNVPVDGNGWIEDVGELLKGAAAVPDPFGTYSVTVQDLTRSGGICHLNTMILRKEFFEKIGGLDENNRYNTDQDLYLRAIDQALFMKYCPARIARHNIPNPVGKSNMSTLVSTFEKRLFQLRVHDKMILFARNSEIKQKSMVHKVYTLKMISEDLYGLRLYDIAFYYAKEALLIGFGIKWLAFCVLIRIKGAFLWKRTKPQSPSNY